MTALPSAGPTLIAESSGNALRAVDRAVVTLRRGGLVLMTETNGEGDATLVMAAERANREGLERLTRLGSGPGMLVLTAPRATALKLPVATGPVIVAALIEPVDATALQKFADPTMALDPLPSTALKAFEGAPKIRDHAAIALTKRALLLPAAITVRVDAAGVRNFASAGDPAVVGISEVIDYERHAATGLRPVDEAPLSLANAEDSRVITFSPSDSGIEHLAVIIGNPYDGDRPPLVRLHSACFTGDLLGSLRCDCGDQLSTAIRAMVAERMGILLYLAQEGRGIGLVNKLRAYNLQDAGFDTLDANIQLGFDADERLYLPAAEMLRRLGCKTLRLMTNNPDKVSGLERNGVTITERIPLVTPASGYNHVYLATKAKRFGHIF